MHRRRYLLTEIIVSFQKYLYESRHRHAMNRQRGNGGVFVGNTGKDGKGMLKTELGMHSDGQAGSILSSLTT